MLQVVESCKPIAPYLGGKFKLAKSLIARIEQIPHDCYAEPFVGMGGVFFRCTAAQKQKLSMTGMARLQICFAPSNAIISPLLICSNSRSHHAQNITA